MKISFRFATYKYTYKYTYKLYVLLAIIRKAKINRHRISFI